MSGPRPWTRVQALYRKHGAVAEETAPVKDGVLEIRIRRKGATRSVIERADRTARP
ncbi:hypothetical protein FHR93_002854 [Geodermatophilus sabuli]|uniref:Uncharacterized protein n=1 Tax=Geodermatophilus sabuli TaxID=1564158 RepID=A0A285EGI1_9ACTN|nr:hypothetical protein [Geodermatophilus sabuli]SNX97166.1 hypothetical protein SAMN06893097_106116 [Geodermatophilus sabuli]